MKQWSWLKLPNGQIACSRWYESHLTRPLRKTTCIKVGNLFLLYCHWTYYLFISWLTWNFCNRQSRIFLPVALWWYCPHTCLGFYIFSFRSGDFWTFKSHHIYMLSWWHRCAYGHRGQNNHRCCSNGPRLSSDCWWRHHYPGERVFAGGSSVSQANYTVSDFGWRQHWQWFQ